MPPIRYPMSPGGGWHLVALYSQYAKRVKRNIDQGNPFEAVALSCLCLDVLLHHVIDGLIVHHKDKLDPAQRRCVQSLRRGQQTSGGIITVLGKAGLLDRRFLRALNQLNDVRNALVHPFDGDKRKSGAITPIEFATQAHTEYARHIFRLLCHIIDLAGGSSPLKDQRYQGGLSREIRGRQEQRKRTASMS